MKEVEAPLEDKVKPFTAVQPTERLAGIVTDFENFGAFVEVTTPTGDTMTGLLHNSEIKDGFVEDPAMELEIGQELQVRIISVDTDNGKIALSLKEYAELEES